MPLLDLSNGRTDTEKLARRPELVPLFTPKVHFSSGAKVFGQRPRNVKDIEGAAASNTLFLSCGETTTDRKLQFVFPSPDSFLDSENEEVCDLSPPRVSMKKRSEPFLFA